MRHYVATEGDEEVWLCIPMWMDPTNIIIKEKKVDSGRHLFYDSFHTKCLE